MITFLCFCCGEHLKIEDSYKSRAECICGAEYKLELGGKEIWREEVKFRGCGMYLATVAETKKVEDIAQ